MGYTDGFQVFHGAPKGAASRCLFPTNLIWPTFTLGPSFTTNGDADLGRRDRLNFGANSGDLAPVSGKQFFQGYFRLLYFRGIVLALRDNPTFRSLKRSSMSLLETELSPRYSISLIVGRSFT